VKAQRRGKGGKVYFINVRHKQRQLRGASPGAHRWKLQAQRRVRQAKAFPLRQPQPNFQTAPVKHRAFARRADFYFSLKLLGQQRPCGPSPIGAKRPRAVWVPVLDGPRAIFLGGIHQEQAVNAEAMPPWAKPFGQRGPVKRNIAPQPSLPNK
jgi:hypothetical protein